MTVRELIAALTKLDPDLPVVHYAWAHGAGGVEEISEVTERDGLWRDVDGERRHAVYLDS